MIETILVGVSLLITFAMLVVERWRAGAMAADAATIAGLSRRVEQLDTSLMAKGNELRRTSTDFDSLFEACVQMYHTLGEATGVDCQPIRIGGEALQLGAFLKSGTEAFVFIKRRPKRARDESGIVFVPCGLSRFDEQTGTLLVGASDTFAMPVEHLPALARYVLVYNKIAGIEKEDEANFP